MNGSSRALRPGRGLLLAIGLALAVTACSSEGDARNTGTMASTTSASAVPASTTPEQHLDCSPPGPPTSSPPPSSDYDTLSAGSTSTALSSAVSPLIPDTFTLADEQELGSPEHPDVYLAFVDKEGQLIYVVFQQLDAVRAHGARAYWTNEGSGVDNLDGACRYTPPGDDSEAQVVVITTDNKMGNVGWRAARINTTGSPPADLGMIAQAVAAFVPP